MKRKLSISPYCTNCRHHILFEFWTDTFPEVGSLTVTCPNCKLCTFELELTMRISTKPSNEISRILGAK